MDRRTANETTVARLALILALALGAMFLAVGAQAATLEKPLFDPVAPAAAPQRQAEPQVVRERFVRIDRDRLGERVELNLFDDLSFQVRRQRTEVTGPDGYVWIGRPEGQSGLVIFSTVGDATVGNVRLGNRVFDISYVAGDVHAISELDSSLFPDEGCGEASDFAPSLPQAPPAESLGGDPCGVIDKMILYTPNARDSAGGDAAIEALIHMAVSVTNISYEDSGVTTRITPVHIGMIEYESASSTGTGNVFTDRNRLRDTADGVMDEVHELRDRYCADVVHLITDYDEDWCGAAYIMDPAPDATHEADAFAVTVDSCAVGNLTFAHELGHLQGARHDWYVDDATTPYTYAHGYVNRPEKWRTIMAYNRECDDAGTSCTRLGIWSNPNVSVDGDPAGFAGGTSTACSDGNLNNPDCDTENWKVLNATDCTVANFRDRSQCSASGARNVWMKDTWNDTGMEPDPWTVGQSMWKSPYIWVRNHPDPTGSRHHIHQNPEAGSTNYVYVKLHNDFDVQADGRLKLYYAQASTGLAWPGDWTQFADTPVNNIAAHGTLIVPSTWNPPGSGHFCLLARWDSPTSPFDPMTSPEGASVSTNTRNNNNIAWRNVNVVNLEPDLAVEVPPAKVKNLEPTTAFVDLEVRLPNNPDNFLRAGGQILLDLGGLLDEWQSSGGTGSNVQVVQHPLYGTVVEILDDPTGGGSTATLSRIVMTPQQTEDVRFILTAPRIPPPPPVPPTDEEPPTSGADGAGAQDPPIDTFELDLVQVVGSQEVGGVGYLIHVAPAGSAGSVPNGADVPGIPLLLTRNAASLDLEWDPSCAGDDDYSVYEGTLGDFTSHLPLTCSTAGATSATIPLPDRNKYYLVVPTDGLAEGSYGRDSAGAERPQSLAGCRGQIVASCP